MEPDFIDQCNQCISCDLSNNRKHVVIGSGNIKSNLMVIGEAPGANEDELGLPFVGRSGLLLKELFASVGIDSERDCYIANLVKCRPPRNRKPSKFELQKLEEEIQTF